MTDEELFAICEQVVDRIIETAPVQKIYLFGSSLDGTMNETSDFDFVIIFKNTDELKKYKKIILRKNLFPDIPADLLFFDNHQFFKKAEIGGICWEIINKGKIIYDQGTKI